MQKGHLLGRFWHEDGGPAPTKEAPSKDPFVVGFDRWVLHRRHTWASFCVSSLRGSPWIGTGLAMKTQVPSPFLRAMPRPVMATAVRRALAGRQGIRAIGLGGMVKRQAAQASVLREALRCKKLVFVSFNRFGPIVVFSVVLVAFFASLFRLGPWLSCRTKHRKTFKAWRVSPLIELGASVGKMAHVPGL